MESRIISYQKEDLNDEVLKNFTDAYCTIFNVAHFMIHPETGHVVGLKTVFGTEDVQLERMYNGLETKKYLKKDYVFFHHPDVTFRRFKEKCFSTGHKPYLSLLLDAQSRVVGFFFGVDYPSFSEMMFHEGWLNRLHYSSTSQFVDWKQGFELTQENTKFIRNIDDALISKKSRLACLEGSISEYEPEGRFFSPNALGIFRDSRCWNTLSELSLSFFYTLDSEIRKSVFIFETTIGTEFHSFLKSIGWIIVNGILTDPYKESPEKGDSVVMIGHYASFIDSYQQLFKKGSATHPN